MPRLVAIDLPASELFVEAVRRTWERGDTVLPVDPRLPLSAKQMMYQRLGVEDVVSSTVASPTSISDTSTVQLPAFGEDVVPLKDGDALMIATSGSTGEPKGVVHTHDSLRASARIVGARLHLSKDDHWWLCIPAAHIGGFGLIARSLHFGSRISYAETIDQSTIDAALENGATRTSVVPTLMVRYRFDRWMTVLVGGASSGNLPHNALSTYGMTETAGGIAYNGEMLSDVQVKVEQGEILLRTPTLARTYRTADLPQRDGWFATGDLGRLTEGRLIVEGRRDDIIITGGVKVWPGVIEARLREHPLIDDVAVTGLPDAEWGMIVVAYVVCSTSNPPSLAQLRNHVKETLSSAHAPQRIVLLQQIPRTTLGKVRRNELPRP